MPESPEPAPPAPSPVSPAPKASRLRRLWRWSRKWGKRVLLLLLVTTSLLVIAYEIYRPFAYRASDKALAEVRTELDASEPDWQYEQIEAAYNTKLPPPDKNSYELLAKFPKVHPRPPDQRLAVNPIEVNLFTQSLNEPLTNELPSADIRKFVDAVAVDVAASDPTIRALARSPVGGAPLIDVSNPFDPVWDNPGNLRGIGKDLELASVATAACGDHAATAIYAHAALNAGRAIGAMPRMRAQIIRKGEAIRATRIVGRMLAWGEPETGLEELQRELLAEADVEWLEAALKGERAVLARVPDRLTSENEEDLLFSHLQPEKPRTVKIEDRMRIYLARPYRTLCQAQELRELTRAIALCNQPPHERLKALYALSAENRRGDAPTMFHRFWESALYVPYQIAATSDCRSRAILRTTAVAIACERFRRANRRWPASLAEIPKTILAAIPLDPFDGQPLRYKRLEVGAVVYSVGRNLRDDGGNLAEKEYGVPLDLGTRLWNPELRGLPPQEVMDPFAPPDVPGPDGPP
jgi:hypothetical protein